MSEFRYVDVTGCSPHLLLPDPDEQNCIIAIDLETLTVMDPVAPQELGVVVRCWFKECNGLVFLSRSNGSVSIDLIAEMMKQAKAMLLDEAARP